MMIGASPPMFIVTKERGVGRESWPSLEFSHHFVSKVMAAASSAGQNRGFENIIELLSDCRNHE